MILLKGKEKISAEGRCGQFTQPSPLRRVRLGAPVADPCRTSAGAPQWLKNSTGHPLPWAHRLRSFGRLAGAVAVYGSEDHRQVSAERT